MIHFIINVGIGVFGGLCGSAVIILIKYLKERKYTLRASRNVGIGFDGVQRISMGTSVNPRLLHEHSRQEVVIPIPIINNQPNRNGDDYSLATVTVNGQIIGKVKSFEIENQKKVDTKNKFKFIKNS
jgi:hypothetical protein